MTKAEVLEDYRLPKDLPYWVLRSLAKLDDKFSTKLAKYIVHEELGHIDSSALGTVSITANIEIMHRAGALEIEPHITHWIEGDVQYEVIPRS